jgi:V8-like Glu-specific endopeptidase
MIVMKKLILGLTALSLVTTATASTKVIYGDDDRVDVYASTNNMYVELSKSTAAMITNSSVVDGSNGESTIKGRSLQDRGMCASERFAKQMSAANCSGFLVGEDLLVTAGHCITNASKCAAYKWVFDFKVDSEDQFNVTVPTSSVYNCKEVIKTVLDRSTSDDYALIRLDRKVTDRRALTFRKTGKISRGENLVVIGHPTGLPTKIADGAQVKSSNNVFFNANLDTYGGNSGSAVFNAKTGEVEGILVRGATDYVRRGGCNVSNRIGNNSGSGEAVTKITNIKELMNL